jgi:HipA-like protein
MIQAIVNKIWKPKGQESFFTPQNISAHFELTYKEIIIGHLKLSDGEWTFEYDNSFAGQNKVQKLIEFPDINIKYKSKELWPFFLSRIPGLGQPKVQEIIKNKQIDRNNEVELLKVFGTRTLTNPFLLVAL